jgi:hypothetical protein
MNAPAQCCEEAQAQRNNHLSFRKNGMRKTRQANKKNKEPNIAQKLPIEATMDPKADTIKRIQPKKFI